MEKNPKKSKALIITIILIVLLLIAGYFIFKNKDSIFKIKTSTDTFTSLPASENKPGFLAKIFSPLLPSSNLKNLTTSENIKTTYAEAGENLKKGDVVYQVGTNKNNLPIVRKTGLQSQNKFGTALEDINMGNIGNFLIDSSFWGSIKDFVNTTTGNIGNWVGGIFRGNGGTGTDSNTCTNGANNPPMCTTIDGNCVNNATNPPLCTTIGNDTNIFPTVTVTATPASIAKGESSTISWESTNADACNAGAGNGTGKTGSFSTGVLTVSRAYTVTCTGVNGTGSGNVLVFVTTGEDGKCINGATNPTSCNDWSNTMMEVNVTATPTQVNSGEKSNITWTSKNATSCALSGGGITGTGTSNSTGVPTKALTNNTSYTVVCTGANNSKMSGNVLVMVNGDDNNTVMEVNVTATPTQVNSGEKSNITWTSKNATSCALSGGGITGTGISSPLKGVPTKALTSTTSYTVVCTGANDSKMSGNAVVMVVVDYKFPTVTVTADPTAVAYNGISTISWKSTKTIFCDAGAGSNGAYATTDGGGTNPSTKSGSFETRALIKSRAYTVTCTGTDGKSKVSGTAYVFVNPEITKPECSDGINNNDNDTLIDVADPECHKSGNPNNPNPNDYDPTWYSENIPAGGNPQCDDGWDNDGDGKIDIHDPQCHSDGITLDKAQATVEGGEGGNAKPTETYNAGTWIKTNLESGSITPPNDTCTDGTTNYPLCTILPNGKCKNNATNPPKCDVFTCPKGETNPPECTTPPLVVNICKDIEQNPLTFTPEEKARLDVLLRKFYLISSTLRTSDDISTIYNDIDNQENFMNQVDGLTKQCYLDVNDRSGYNDFCSRNPSLCNKTTDELKFNVGYKDQYYYNSEINQNLTLRRGNPWYPAVPKGDRANGKPFGFIGTFPYTNRIDAKDSDGNPSTFGYLDLNWLEGNYSPESDGKGNIVYSSLISLDGGTGPGCNVVSGYYYGTVSTQIGYPDNLYYNGGPSLRVGADCDGLNFDSLSGERFDNTCYYTNLRVTGNDEGNDVSSTPPLQTYLEAGCKWKAGVDLGSTEKILNIW